MGVLLGAKLGLGMTVIEVLARVNKDIETDTRSDTPDAEVTKVLVCMLHAKEAEKAGKVDDNTDCEGDTLL